MFSRPLPLVLVLAVLAAGCAAPLPEPGAAAGARQPWAIALHGGAGAIPRDTPAEQRERYLESLEAALRHGVELLESGAASLDVVEEVIRALEDDPLFNAGKGAVFNAAGGNELDASIMDGRDLACGAVAGVTTVKNPIGLARRVMERTPHVLLAGAGAETFADEQQVERVDADYFFTQRRWDALQSVQQEEHGTVGVAALDRAGNLAAGTSTGGLTNKRYGRVGDSPIVGAGTYADNRTCAVSGTGKGEEFIRHGVARSIAMLMESGQSLKEAAEEIVVGRLEAGQGGIIAVDRDGRIAMVYNTDGMYRGAADASGRFGVHIWE